MLDEETLEGFEITLQVGIPNIYACLEINCIHKIDLGEVQWKLSLDSIWTPSRKIIIT